jgi:hypothetical protein
VQECAQASPARTIVQAPDLQIDGSRHSPSLAQGPLACWAVQVDPGPQNVPSTQSSLSVQPSPSCFGAAQWPV